MNSLEGIHKKLGFIKFKPEKEAEEFMKLYGHLVEEDYITIARLFKMKTYESKGDENDKKYNIITLSNGEELWIRASDDVLMLFANYVVSPSEKYNIEMHIDSNRQKYFVLLNNKYLTGDIYIFMHIYPGKQIINVFIKGCIDNKGKFLTGEYYSILIEDNIYNCLNEKDGTLYIEYKDNKFYKDDREFEPNGILTKYTGTEKQKDDIIFCSKTIEHNIPRYYIKSDAIDYYIHCTENKLEVFMGKRRLYLVHIEKAISDRKFKLKSNHKLFFEISDNKFIIGQTCINVPFIEKEDFVLVDNTTV